MSELTVTQALALAAMNPDNHHRQMAECLVLVASDSEMNQAGRRLANSALADLVAQGGCPNPFYASYATAFVIRWMGWCVATRSVLARHWKHSQPLHEVSAYALIKFGSDLARRPGLDLLAEVGIDAHLLREVSAGRSLELAGKAYATPELLAEDMEKRSRGSAKRRGAAGKLLGLSLIFGVGSGVIVKATHIQPPVLSALLPVLAVLVSAWLLLVQKCVWCHLTLSQSRFAESNLPLLNRLACCGHCGAEIDDQTVAALFRTL